MKWIAREQARVVTEYFEPFTLLGIDYTYYCLLLEKDGKSTLEFSCP